MRTLTDRATKILWEILSLRTSKVDRSNGAYPPLTVEIINETPDWRVISLAHYADNDLKAQPEICFLHDRKTDNVFPYYYRNDFVGITSQSMKFEDGRVFMLDLAIQNEHASLANLWLYTIAKQQNIIAP